MPESIMHREYPDHDPPLETVTPDRSSRFPLDQQLRRLGYKIYSRPRRGEPIWQSNGILVAQSDAVQDLVECRIRGLI